jgi:hypothetical protein
VHSQDWPINTEKRPPTLIHLIEIETRDLVITAKHPHFSFAYHYAQPLSGSIELANVSRDAPHDAVGGRQREDKS